MNFDGVLYLLSLVAFSVVFMLTYFKLYAPGVITSLSYPEGRYGPPLVREQFVASIAFAVLLGCLGFIPNGLLPASKTVTSNIFCKMEGVSVENEIQGSLRNLLGFLPVTFGTALVGYAVMMNIFGQPILKIASFLISWFIPLRPTFHSFWNCFEGRLLYHFCWVLVSVSVLWEIVNLCIGLIFGNSFDVSRHSANPTLCLINGLSGSSKHPLVQGQAAFELYQILAKNPARRTKFYNDFLADDDTPVSKVLADWLNNYGNGLMKELKGDIKILNDLQEALLAYGNKSKQSFTTIEPRHLKLSSSKIFASKPKSLFTKYFSPFLRSESLESVNEIIPSSNASPKMPEILSIKTSHFELKPAETSKRQTVEKSLLAEYLPKIIELPFGSYLLSLMIQYIRCRHFIDQQQRLIILIQNLKNFMIHSYDEDKLGQVQMSFDKLMKLLLDIPIAVIDLYSIPQASDLIPDLAMSPENQEMFEKVIQEAYDAVLAIEGKFQDCWDQVKLSKSTLEQLDKFHNQVSSHQKDD